MTHGQEDALVHWSKARGLKARPLAIVGYGDEDESDGTTDGATGETPSSRAMNKFAELLDRLAYEPGRNNKLRLIAGLSAHHAGSRARLCARGADRRAVVPARQGRASSAR